MVLGADELKEAILYGYGNLIGDEQVKLFEDISIEQVEELEGTVVDLRLRNVYILKENNEVLDLYDNDTGFLLNGSRTTPKYEELFPLDLDEMKLHELKYRKDLKQPIWKLCKHSDYLIETEETINLGHNLWATLHPKVTWGRCGITYTLAPINPGYRGKLTFLIKTGKTNVYVQKGYRICVCAIHEISGKTVPYSGVWQGGDKVSVNNERDH